MKICHPGGGMHERLRNEEWGRIKKCKKFVFESQPMSQDGDDENDKNLNMTDKNIFSDQKFLSIRFNSYNINW